MVWVAIGAIVLVALGAAFFLSRPESSGPDGSAAPGASADPGGSAQGQGQIGTAPLSPGASTAPPGSRAAPGSAATPGVAPAASATAAGTTPVIVKPAALSATYRQPAILGGTYDLVVANSGDVAAEGWTVTVLLDGLGLTVEGRGGVTHEARRERHVFSPMATISTVPAHGSVNFSFTVQGVLPAVRECTVNDVPCTAAT